MCNDVTVQQEDIDSGQWDCHFLYHFLYAHAGTTGHVLRAQGYHSWIGLYDVVTTLCTHTGSILSGSVQIDQSDCRGCEQEVDVNRKWMISARYVITAA